MYHNVAAEKEFNTVSRRAFLEQIQYIMSERRIVSIDEYARSLICGARIDGGTVLTFDDGYISFRTEALPLLEKLAIPAVLFVPVDHVGGTNTWERAGARILNLLTWDELNEIGRHDLVTIGSHGLTHRSLRKLTGREQHDEMAISKKELEARLGCGIGHFSYPYGQRRDFSRETMHIVEKSGYVSACSTLYGRTNRQKDRYCLRRIEVRPDDTFEYFKTLCTTDLHKVYIKQRVKEAVQRFV
jgi:peptidoglycan/xylan/chitin deacetylase (PgdA/CDA1 family)